MRVLLHREACVGHGRCYALCPEVFEEDEEGYCVIPRPDVPPHLVEKVLVAAHNCPEHAILIERAD